MSGQESFCFSTLPHHPAGRRQTCRTRLSVDKSIEATTPHGPASWLSSCVLAVARRFECSEVARTAYGACASDRRSVGAWTERAPNLRGREGDKISSPGAGRAHPTARSGTGGPAGDRAAPTGAAHPSHRGTATGSCVGDCGMRWVSITVETSESRGPRRFMSNGASVRVCIVRRRSSSAALGRAVARDRSPLFRLVQKAERRGTATPLPDHALHTNSPRCGEQ